MFINKTCLTADAPHLVGDPIDTLTGAVVDRMIDFRLIGPIDFRWERQYDSSQNHRMFALGRGAAHDFERSLQFEPTSIQFLHGMRPPLTFPLLHRDGDRRAMHGLTLWRVSRSIYRVLQHAQPVTEFNLESNADIARLCRIISGNEQICFWYDNSGRLERINDSLGNNMLVREDEGGRILDIELVSPRDNRSTLLVSYCYDIAGNMISTKNANGIGYQFRYDAGHRMILRCGRKGFQFYYTYDEQGRCVVAEGDDHLQGIIVDYIFPGRVTQVKRNDGGLWKYKFSKRGELTEIIDPYGGTRKFIRNSLGRLALEIDENGNASSYLYNEAGHPVARICPRGNRINLPEDINAPDLREYRIAANAFEYEYGQLLDLPSLQLPRIDQVQNLKLSVEALSMIITKSSESSLEPRPRPYEVSPLRANWWPSPSQGRAFNDFGQLKVQHDQNGRKRTWNYDASGNVAEFNDFDSGRWTFDYEKWHLLRSVTNPLGSKSQITYTEFEKVASAVDAGGTFSQFRYDLRDHLVEVIRNGVTRETYQRDLAGNLLGKYASDGRELIRFENGAMNLVKKKILASGDNHEFAYDSFGRCIMAATKSDQVQFSFDDFNNCTQDERGGMGLVARFRNEQLPLQLLCLKRFSVNYAWKKGELAITDPGGKIQRVCFHIGGIIERKFSNGSREISQHDHNGRCLFKRWEHGEWTDWSRQYYWSGEGQLRRVQDNVRGEIRYDYDAAGRLRRRTSLKGSEEFEIDNADNILKQPGLTKTSFLPGNKLKSANETTFSYNDRQHIAARQDGNDRTEYYYDSRDQLVRVETAQGVWSAEYDAMGRRTRRTWKEQTTEYYWYGDQLLADIDQQGKLRLYVYLDTLALTPFLFLDYASIDSDPKDCKRYFVYSDQIGTPNWIEDEMHRQVWKAEMKPFGKVQVSSDSSIEFNLRFPGHYYDNAIDLHYNRFRYYDPVLARYIQSDPWGIAGGLNLYAYRMNPLGEVDVRGLGEGNDENAKQPGKDGPDAESPLVQATKEAAAENKKLPQKDRPSITNGMEVPGQAPTTAGSYKGPRGDFDGLAGAPKTQAAYNEAAKVVVPPANATPAERAAFPEPHQSGKCGEAANMANHERATGEMPPPGTKLHSVTTGNGQDKPACPYCSHVANQQGYESTSGTTPHDTVPQTPPSTPPPSTPPPSTPPPSTPPPNNGTPE